MTDSEEEHEDTPVKKRNLSDDEEEDELDEEDFNLIQENTGVNLQQTHKFKRLKRKEAAEASANPTSGLDNIFDDDEEPENDDKELEEIKKPKKVTSFVSYDREEDDMDDFIVDDEGDEYAAVESAPRPRQKKTTNMRFDVAEELGFSPEAWNEVYDLFGDGTDYSYALGATGEWEDEEYSNKAESLPKKIDEIYEPAEVKEKMYTEEDERIRDLDIPERFQTREVAFRDLYSGELEKESLWIAFRLKRHSTLKNDIHSGHPIVSVIAKVLTFIRVDYLEVMFIQRHRRDDFEPHLNEAEIWEIYDLDERWMHIDQRKNSLKQWIEIAPHLSQVLEECSDEDGLRDISEYLQLRYSREMENQRQQSSQGQQSSSTKFKRPVRRDMYQTAIDSKLGDFAVSFGISPEQFGENLIENFKSNIVEDPELAPTEMAEAFKCADFRTSDSVLAATRYIISRQMSTDLKIRAALRTILFDICFVDVTPTEKGKIEIDYNHPFASFKYLKKKPVQRFADSQFLAICKGEEDGLLQVEISVDHEKLNELLCNFYLSDNESAVALQWNEERKKILNAAFDELLVPSMKKWLVQNMKNLAIDHVLWQCRQNFEDKLKVGPYQIRSDDDDESIKLGFRVFALSTGGGDQKSAAFGVLLSQKGEVIDYLKLGHIHLRSQDLKQADLQKIRDFLEKNTRRDSPPLVVAVSGWSVDAHFLYEELQKILEEYPETTKERLFLMMVRDEVARIYKNTKKAAEDFPAYPPLLKYCISIGRFLLEPILEYAGLFDSDQSILFLKHHPQQSLLPQEKLFKTLERCFIEKINYLGVDLNRVIHWPTAHLALPFICGLGRRKSQLMIGRMKSIGVVEVRADLVKEIGLGKVIFTNCASFLKITDQYIVSRRNVELDPFDSTRIHPEDYKLAKKIVMDACEDEDADSDELAARIADIRHESEKLESLELEDYAIKIEESTGQKKLLTLKMIKDELLYPYNDDRSTYTQPSLDEVFMMLTGESSESLRPGMIVACLVTRVRDKNAAVRLDCGLEGSIVLANLTDNSNAVKCSDIVQEGQSLRCKILKLQKDRFLIDVVAKDSELSKPDVLPRFEKDEYYNEELARKDDHKQAIQTKGLSRRVRNIVHPLYENINYKEAERRLRGSHPGSMIFRPSSQGPDIIVVTWKVMDNVIQHVEIREENKESEFVLGKQLRIDQDVFSDLDEISVRYVGKLSQLAREIVSFPKFKLGTKEELFAHIDREMLANPRRIPYVFGCSDKSPGQFTIVYKYSPNHPAKQDTIILTMQGFKFRGHIASDIHGLMALFKKAPQDSHSQSRRPPVAKNSLRKTQDRSPWQQPPPQQYSYNSSSRNSAVEPRGDRPTGGYPQYRASNSNRNQPERAPVQASVSNSWGAPDTSQSSGSGNDKGWGQPTASTNRGNNSGSWN